MMLRWHPSIEDVIVNSPLMDAQCQSRDDEAEVAAPQRRHGSVQTL
jgi:hypothetical protein